MDARRVAVLGAGLAGACTALALARRGVAVDLVDRGPAAVTGASLHNEGKLHLGYVYGADPMVRTHERLAHGSLRFTSIVAELTGVPAASIRRSRPFLYGIPADTQVPLADLVTHFARVDATLARLAAELPADPPVGHGGPPPRTSQALSAFERAAAFDPETVIAAIRTDEIAVDPRQVADLIAARLAADDCVTLHLGTRVVAAAAVPGGFRVECATAAGRRTIAAPVVVNCLWEDRIRVDTTLGIAPARRSLMRYKAAIRFTVPPGTLARELPSATFVLGPYGDLVSQGDGRYYLSWYPVCKLAETTADDAAPLHAAAARADDARLFRESLAGLARFVPALGRLDPCRLDATVGGGVIVAGGHTDITDLASGLHQRSQIGLAAHGRWISCDTGKYCTAPLFGIEAARMAADMVA